MVGIRHSVATATVFLKYGTKHDVWTIAHMSPSKRPPYIWYIKSLTNYYASANTRFSLDKARLAERLGA